MLEYRAFSDAIEHGAFVKELDQGASVNRLLVGNPTDRALLLYEGEQVIGAQQDRAMDSNVLVGAGAQVEVPVSCVEQGRWDGRRHDEHFKPAPHADDPSLRRIKRESALRSAEQGLAGRPAQGEVWHEVGSRLRHFGVDSQSSKFGDLFEQRRGEIGALADDIEPAADQVGALACVGGAPIALDVVSRPEVFRALHDRLVRGYALDALSAGPAQGNVADQAAAGAFLARALTASRRPVPTPGLGRGARARRSADRGRHALARGRARGAVRVPERERARRRRRSGRSPVAQAAAVSDESTWGCWISALARAQAQPPEVVSSTAVGPSGRCRGRGSFPASGDRDRW